MCNTLKFLQFLLKSKRVVRKERSKRLQAFINIFKRLILNKRLKKESLPAQYCRHPLNTIRQFLTR